MNTESFLDLLIIICIVQIHLNNDGYWFLFINF